MKLCKKNPGIQHCHTPSLVIDNRDNDSVQTSPKTTHKDPAATLMSYNAYKMARKGTWCGGAWRGRNSQCRSHHYCKTVEMDRPCKQDVWWLTTKSCVFWGKWSLAIGRQVLQNWGTKMAWNGIWRMQTLMFIPGKTKPKTDPAGMASSQSPS